MATTTHNLGLTLPIGSEKVSRQILNGNFSLIDTAYGTLNSKIPKNVQFNNATDDLNLLVNDTDTGLYGVGHRTLNRPVDWCDVYAFANQGMCSQIAIKNNEFYFRYKANASSEWTSWEKLALNSNVTKTAINTGITGVTAYKASNIVILHLQISTAISGGKTSGWVVIGTLPQELYPPRMVYGIVCDNNATGRSNLPIQVSVNTTGEMKVYLYANESAKLYGEIVY